MRTKHSAVAARLLVISSFAALSFSAAALAAPAKALPVVRGLELSLDEDTSGDGAVAASAEPGETLTLKVARAPRHGDVTLDATSGAFHYVPARDYTGDDAFVVEAKSAGRTSSAAITLHVNPVNDAPTMAPTTLKGQEDRTLEGAVRASDIDRDVVTYRIGKAAAHGEAWVDRRSGQLKYRPNDDWFGADVFSVEASDGAATANAEVAVTVTPVNDPPFAKITTQSCDEDALCEGSVLASDVDQDQLTYTVQQLPRHGTVEVEAATGAFRFTPARDFHGPDSFTVKVSDGALVSEGTVRLQLKPVNDAPAPSPLTLSGREDEPLTGAPVVTDVDGDALRFAISTQPAHGTVTIDARSGAVRYAPTANYFGDDSFEANVSDGTASAPFSVSVKLLPVEDPPVLSTARLSFNEDEPTVLTLSATDGDNDPLTFRLLKQPLRGTAELLDGRAGSLKVTPKLNFNGDDGVTVSVTDGKSTVTGVVPLSVLPINDAPTVAALNLRTREDQPVAGRVIGNDVDGDKLTYAVGSQPAQGKATVDASTGAVRFEPAKDHNGQVTFTVVARDQSLASAPATVTVSIDPVNDAPIARLTTVSVDEDSSVQELLLANDVDGDRLKFRITRTPQHGKLVLTDEAGGTFSYTPSPNYFGPDAFAFDVADPARLSSAAEVKLTVNSVNDVPTAITEHVSAPCRGSISGRLQWFDRESSQVTFRITEQPKIGAVKLNDPKTGDYTYSAEEGAGETATFKFVVFDGTDTSAPGEVIIHRQAACRTSG